MYPGKLVASHPTLVGHCKPPACAAEPSAAAMAEGGEGSRLYFTSSAPYSLLHTLNTFPVYCNLTKLCFSREAVHWPRQHSTVQ